MLLELFISKHIKKSKIKICQNKFYNKNKEKINKYRKNNKKKIKKYQKEYYEKNKRERNEYNKNYRNSHKEERKEYRKTPEGYKAERKYNWKQMGLNMENFEEIFNRYMNTTNCENCNVLLTRNRYTYKTTKVLDHNHITGEFRNVLCFVCNIRRR